MMDGMRNSYGSTGPSDRRGSHQHYSPLFDEPNSGGNGGGGHKKVGSRVSSTGTLSTLPTNDPPSSSSSSSSSGSQDGDAGNGMQHMSIDLDGMSDSSDGRTISVSSSSDDLSSNNEETLPLKRCPPPSPPSKRKDYLAQLATRAMLRIEETILTMSNLKVVLSFLTWYVSYMIMGVIGGSVAFLHFPRVDKDEPDPLPDFGYDIIPYWCPAIPHCPHGNVQSVVLLFLYSLIFGGVVTRWHARVYIDANTGKKSTWGGDGRLILQQLYHLNTLVFLTRTSTVVMTGLPQPNPKCINAQKYPVTYVDAVRFVVGRGFPPHACGDLIYSGHVGCTLICLAVLHRHGFLRNGVVRAIVWAVAGLGIYCTISCRSHYTVDVVLAFYFGYFLPEFYFTRADGVIGGRVSRLIRWLEVHPGDVVDDGARHGDAGKKESEAEAKGVVLWSGKDSTCKRSEDASFGMAV